MDRDRREDMDTNRKGEMDGRRVDGREVDAFRMR